MPGQTLADALGPLPDGVELIEWTMEGPAPAPHIDIVVQPYMFSLEPFAHLDGVTSQLIQSQSIGYNGVADVLPAGFRYANAASVHEDSTAELTLALILAAQRGIPEFVRSADAGRWEPLRRPSLADRKVLLIGYGGVGKAIEDRLLPFQTEVTRIASRARDTDRGHVHGIDELDELLPDAEVIVVGTPLTPATERLVDAAFLAKVQDDALVVNIARGLVFDTDAMIAEASSGRLRFALDVTDPEPLPDGHPLFALKNVLISPHVGGATSAMMPRMARLLRTQIERLQRGEEPLNVVLPARA
ncbi:MAG: 2-hydroxyacid dehydrogenase [Solirubrobacterales bacterium]